MPSRQIQTYLQMRAANATVEQACAQSGIGAAEAELWERDIASGEVELPRVRAPAPAPAREDQPKEEESMTSGEVNGEALRLFIERLDRLEDEIRGLNEDKRDVIAEAKAQGFDTWAIKAVRKLRKLEPHVLQERDAILQCYIEAVGMSPVEQAIALAA